MAELFELNPEHSTTRFVTREVPTIEEPPDAAFKTVLFLPEGEGRQGEGGLRTKGYFKRSLPDKPLITVITVVFNGAQHLEETILSVIGQTYDNVEYIVIDGGSTDGTLDIIRKYEHAIDYWVSEKDGGIYDAMNKGIDLTTGIWINFMNTGDLFYTNDVLSILKMDKKKSKIIYGSTLFRYDYEFFVIKHPPSVLNFRRGLPFCHQSVIIDSLLQKRSRFISEYKIYSDYCLLLDLFSAGIVFEHVNIVISSVTYDGVSSSRSIRAIKEFYSVGSKHYNLHFFVGIGLILRDVAKKFLPLKFVRKIQLSK